MVRLAKIVFGTLLSLSVYGLATSSVDQVSEKCPFDTEKAKKWMLLIILIVSIVVLLMESRKHRIVKSTKTAPIMQ